MNAWPLVADSVSRRAAVMRDVQSFRIKDRFLAKDLSYFDQRSSNEGFLFLLFYFALVISCGARRYILMLRKKIDKSCDDCMKG